MSALPYVPHRRPSEHAVERAKQPESAPVSSPKPLTAVDHLKRAHGYLRQSREEVVTGRNDHNTDNQLRDVEWRIEEALKLLGVAVDDGRIW